MSEILSPTEFLQEQSAPDTANLVYQAASKHGVDPDLVHSVIKQESGGNPSATSPKGAVGLMQLMPDTAKSLGVTDAYDPQQNIEGGVKLLRRLQDKYGDTAKALAAYNAGEGAVDRAGGVPPIPETQNYVRSVTSDYQSRSNAKKSMPSPSEFIADPLNAMPERAEDLPSQEHFDQSHQSALQRLRGTLANPGGSPDKQSPAKDPLDWSDRYNTPLSPADELRFRGWKQKYAPNDTGADYDLRGAFKAGIAPDPERGHFPDTFKKPNHPTFSDESQYSGKDGFVGGHWGEDNSYTPSATNLKLRSAADLQKYFQQNEPETKLNLPVSSGHPSPSEFLSDPSNAAHPTVLENLRRRLQPTLDSATAAVKGAIADPSSLIPSPIRALPGMVHDTAAGPLIDKVNEHGIIRPLQDALRPPTQYDEPEPTTTAGKVAQGVGAGVTRTAEALTTPENLALLAGTEGLGLIPKIGALLPKAVSAYFGATMFKAAYDKIPEVKQAIDKGDVKGAAQAITEAAASGALGSLAAFHVVSGEPRVSRGTSSAEPETTTSGKIPPAPASNIPSPTDFLAGEAGGAPARTASSVAISESRTVGAPEDIETPTRAQSAVPRPSEFLEEQVAPVERAGQGEASITQGPPSNEAAKGELAAPKPLWMMSPEELAGAEQEAKNRDKSDLVDLFGVDGAQRYARLERVANSSTRSHEETAAASTQLEQMEAALPEAGRNRLYGIGDDRPQLDEIQQHRQALGRLDWSSPEALGDSLKYAVTGIGDKTDPATMTTEERTRYAQLRYAMNEAQRIGWDPVQVSAAALRGAAGRFEQGDAGFMLKRFAGGEVVPEPAAIERAKPPREPATPPAVGRGVAIAVPGEQTSYPARYMVRELSDVQPSHNPQSFEANPAYEHTNDRDYSQASNAARVVKNASPEVFNPEFPTTESPTAEHGAPIIDQRGNVLGGNSRTMSLARVYARNGEDADAYREAVANKAQQFGIDPAELDRFKQPVLLREAQGDVDAQKAITDFNKGAPAALSPEERAVSDGRRLSGKTVADLASRLGETGDGATMAEALRGDNGAEVINNLVKDGVLTEQEKGGYVDDRDQLTPEAKSRIAKALVGRLFDDPGQFRDTPPAMRAKLERIAPHVLRVENRPGWDLTAKTREALVLSEDARAHGMTPQDVADQPDLKGKRRGYSQEAIRIAETLQESPRNAEYAFRRYANDEQLSRPGAQKPMFEPPTRAQAFADAFGEGGTEAAASRVPRLPDDIRKQDYYSGAPTEWHAERAQFGEIPLTAGEKRFADAYVTNPSGMEILGRAIGRERDEVGSHLGGVHIGPNDVGKVARQMAAIMDTHARSTEPVRKMIEAFRGAEAQHKSVVMISDHARWGNDYHETALAEELSHAVQAQIRGTTRNHMPTKSSEFIFGPVAEKAAAALRKRGYSTGADGNEMAIEIGARLMRPDGYKELGLSVPEARSLAATYVRTLREEYGNEKPRDIAKAVFAAARDRETEPGAESSSTRPARGEGPAGRSEPDLSGYRHGERGSGAGHSRNENAEQAAEPSLFDEAEERQVAEESSADRSKLEGDRLTAQFKAPVSREEQTQKLKRDKTQRQADLFGGGIPEKTQGTLFDKYLPEEDKPGRDLEAMRLAQRARRDNPDLTLSEFSKAMGARFPSLSKPDLVKLFTGANAGEKGAFRIDPAAMRQSFKNSRAQDVLDIAKRLGTRIRQEGNGAGNRLMDMIEKSELEGGVDAGRMFARWADAEPSKLTRDQRFELTDALEGRAEPKDPQVQRAFEAARGISDEIAGEATARGVEIRTKNGKRPFMALENYFPHTQVGNADALESGPIRKDVIENITRQGIQPTAAAAGKMVDDWVSYLKNGKPVDSTLDYLVKTKQAPDKATALANLQRYRKNIDRQGNIEYSRDLNLPFYDPNPLRVLPRVISSSARRLNQIAQFGQEHEKINAEILKIAQFGGNADFVRKSVDRIIGNVEGGKTAEERIARFAMALQTLKLPYVGLQHATQGLNTLLATDMPTLAAGMAAAFGKAGKRFSIESGAGAEPAIRDALRQAGSGDKRWADAYLRATGLSTVMRFNRALAANTGAKWAKKNFALLQAGGSGAAIAKTRLENMGIDPQAALDRGSLGDRDFLRAAKSMSDYTMFRNKPQDLPDVFTGTPVGRVITQFKHWGYQESTMVADQIKRDFKEGSGRGLRTLLILGTVFPAAGGVVSLVRDAINGKDREFDSGVDQYIYSLMHSSALGMAGEALNSASSHHALEFLAGPTAGDVATLGDIMADSKKDAGEKLDAIKKYAVQRFAGPARRLVDDQ